MLNDKKTIFALATPPGKSGVAVVRISGSNAFLCLDKLIKKSVNHRKAELRELIDPITNLVIDKAIILTFPGPNSFTGEDVIELHIHGSHAVINIIIKTLSNFTNFRLANPGEFAKRAFLNGKMDLTAAEGLSDLIEAETLVQQQQAMRQMQGQLANIYEDWKNRIIKIMAFIEAYLDFPDEDIPKDIVLEIEEKILRLKTDIAKHLDDKQRGEIIRRGIHVAILGAPNVGKSSLLNYLAKKEVAIVSNIAGTTRDVIEVNLDLSGYQVIIADTAGIRESEDVIEQEGVKRALIKAENSDIKIIMLSAEDPESFKDEILSKQDSSSIILINKIDKKSDFKKIDNAIEISLLNNQSLELFLNEITKLIKEKFSLSQDPVITRERHRYHLNRCLESLNFFSLEQSLELCAEDLRIAARSLGQIVGNIDVETILDEVFSSFCIGK